MKKKSKQGSPAAQTTNAAGLALQNAIEESPQGPYILRLFVTGMTPRSHRAIENVKKICEEYLPGRFELDIIDIYQQPIFARDGQIVAAPTLVKELPPPLRKFIGDMSQTDRILMGLDLRTKG